MQIKLYLFIIVLFFIKVSAIAIEYPIDSPKSCADMEIAAVYLQPIDMHPSGIIKKFSESDIHIEADIHAKENNKMGFQEGSWVPYLNISYKIEKNNSKYIIQGIMHPMIANDGPHYGDNIKLFGPGLYTLQLSIFPPLKKYFFGRHIDLETGVSDWFDKCLLKYNFIYAGTGKKGGY